MMETFEIENPIHDKEKKTSKNENGGSKPPASPTLFDSMKNIIVKKIGHLTSIETSVADSDDLPDNWYVNY